MTLCLDDIIAKDLVDLLSLDLLVRWLKNFLLISLLQKGFKADEVGT